MTDATPKDKEIAELRQKLNEAEETLRAITGGEVDALVVQANTGEQIFTLQGADTIYRTAIENINEGILSLTPEGVILYANHYFAHMMQADLNHVIGASIYDFISPQSRSLVSYLLDLDNGRDEITLLALNKTKIPAYIAIKKLQLEKSVSISAVVTDLTQQKRSEEAMAAGRLIQAINSIFHEYMVTDTQEALGASCLKVVQGMTRSDLGFILAEEPAGTFRDLTANTMAWDAGAMKDKTGHQQPRETFAIKGLFGKVIKEGKSVLANNPKFHPDSTGTPPGNPQITSFLGVPLNYQDKTIGMLALANRDGGYTSEELRTAEALAPAIVEVLMRKKAEEEVIGYRDHLEQLVAERTRELRDLAHRLVDAQEKERAEIGSSLHDEIGQFLTYTTLLIDKAARKPDPQTLIEARSTVQEAISKIRDLSSMLSPNLLRSAGLVQALAFLVDEYKRRTKVHVDFTHNGSIKEIPEDASLACYRIVQESLTNIIRHAGATGVKVQLTIEEDNLRCNITDNGVGFEPDKMKRTTGLTGMRERAVALGGEFLIDSSPGQGTKITAVIPLSERKQ